MCGIAGYWNNGGVRGGVAERMIEAIRHRGPDGRGFFNTQNVSIGSCRLSIIDLATGDQPIFNEDKTVAIVFNGEIYNFKDLHDRLVQQGHQFKTASDTEVVVHLYEERGFDCLRELNGMFAFAIFDARKNILFLARDRVGVKPLVWMLHDGELSFASELKGLCAGMTAKPELNHDALSYYFTFGFIPAPHTIYKNIFKLEPAHYLVFDGKEVKKRRYWNIPRDIRESTESQAIKELYALTEQAVERRLIADVPLGAFLSGGFDSSVVVAFMKKLAGSVETFSIGFEGPQFFNELPQAERVAKYFGVKNHSEVISAKTVEDLIPTVLDNLDEPFADSSILPTYLLSKITHKKVKAALSGDGGDELFVGYEKYRGHYWSEKRMAPSFLLNLINVLPISRESRAGELLRKIKKFKEGAKLSLSERHFLWSSIFNSDRLLKVSGDAKTHYLNLFEGESSLEQALLVDMEFNLPHDMLTKVDLASMWNSLEVRSPFLDYTLVEFMFSLPLETRFKEGQLKYLAKEAFRELVPGFVLKYRKQGFEIPIGEWIRDDLKKDFLRLIEKGKKKYSDSIDFTRAEIVLEEHLRRKADHSKLLWALFVFLCWTNSRG